VRGLKPYVWKKDSIRLRASTTRLEFFFLGLKASRASTRDLTVTRARA